MTGEELLNLPVYCSICTTPVPPDRKRHRSVTCTPEHQALRSRILRAKQDQKKCRYCLRPVTPEQRSAFRRFAALQRRASQSQALKKVMALAPQWKEAQLDDKESKELNELLRELAAMQPDKDEETEDVDTTERADAG